MGVTLDNLRYVTRKLGIAVRIGANRTHGQRVRASYYRSLTWTRAVLFKREERRRSRSLRLHRGRLANRTTRDLYAARGLK